jgi:predicted membrane-bound mannosyltransferase
MDLNAIIDHYRVTMSQAVIYEAACDKKKMANEDLKIKIKASTQQKEKVVVSEKQLQIFKDQLRKDKVDFEESENERQAAEDVFQRATAVVQKIEDTDSNKVVPDCEGINIEAMEDCIAKTKAAKASGDSIGEYTDEEGPNKRRKTDTST